ncbi:MAG: double-strand break repair protein AddB [Alphaproteobacteria bacterium]
MAKVYSIPADQPFSDRLAAGVMARHGADPTALSDVLILLPTRRACRALRDAFLRVSGGAGLLLPSMRPIGDVDEEALQVDAGLDDRLAEALAEVPPAIDDLRRQMLLARLILKRGEAEGEPVTPEQAVLLAAALADLIDQVHTEGLDFADLPALVKGELAEYWQHTLDFMTIVTAAWPAVLAEEGRIDPADRRNRMIDALTDLWQREPPAYPVIAAGSTGSIPASAELMRVVAGLPEGAVVLPGLDRVMTDDAWQMAIADEAHPQFGLARLIVRFGLTRESVRPWMDGQAESSPRLRLLSDTLLPAAATGAWRQRAPGDYGEDMAALDGFRRLDCPGPEAESGAIALMLRQALEQPTRTAALITPDRALARRVAAALRRWDIEVDDSAGTPLTAMPVGVYFLAVLAAVQDGFSPVALLGLLKHPLSHGGLAKGAVRAMTRLLERHILRGPKPAPGLDALRLLAMESPDRDVIADRESILALLDRLEQVLGAFSAAISAPDYRMAGDLLTLHAGAAEALAATDVETGAARLWRGDDGESLAGFISELQEAARDLPPIAPDAYAALIPALMQGRTVRPAFGAHPRLSIWGPLEARLQHADLVVLGGLNEGVWPPEPAPDPWMSRPMRKQFGLPAPERRVGLSAHDFAQAAAASRVILTRAEKTDGQPTVPSRWLTRLDALLAHLKWEDVFRDAGPWLGWRSRLIESGLPARPVERPAPRPPVEARPTGLSATRIDVWIRDPYVIFAQYILALEPLDPLEADPGAAERGTYIHNALDAFVAAHAGSLPETAYEDLLARGREAFGPALTRPGIRSFWWPRFERIARWFVAEETKRRAGIDTSFTEIKGTIRLETETGGFTIRATADRIDRLASGGFAIVDYKTGQPPSEQAVIDGKSPQLPLEAAILGRGGFPGINNGSNTEILEYWRLSGGDPPGEIKALKKVDPSVTAEEAVTGVIRLANAFADPATPYLAMPRPSFALRFNDYAHLARVAEWALADGGQECP